MKILLRNLTRLPFSLDVGDFDGFGDMVRELLAPAGSPGDTIDIGGRVDPWSFNVQQTVRSLVVPPGTIRSVTAVPGGYTVTSTPPGVLSVTFLETPDDLVFLFFGSATSDHKVAVSGTDTTPDYLSPKLVAGSGIMLTVLFPGADEKVSISATSTLPPASSVGQVLYSVDGLAFTKQQPLTSQDGWLVNDEGHLLVVGDM